jgi:hypothetical protein
MTCNRDEDFDHPLVPAGHKLQRHVLFRLSKHEFEPTQF